MWVIVYIWDVDKLGSMLYLWFKFKCNMSLYFSGSDCRFRLDVLIVKWWEGRF